MHALALPLAAALQFWAAAAPVTGVEPIHHRGRTIDLDAFLEGYPYTGVSVDLRTAHVFYRRKGVTDELMMTTYDPHSTEAIDLSKGKVVSPRDFSKRNLWGEFFNPLTQKAVLLTDDHNDEVMNFVELDPATGAERALTHVGYVYGWEISDDGKLLAYASRTSKDELSPGDVRVLDLATGKETIAFHDTHEVKMVWGALTWRPDNSGLLVPFQADSDRTRRNLLYVPLDPTQKPQVLTDVKVKRSSLSPLNHWLDRDTFLYTSDEADFTGVYRGSLKGGRTLLTAASDNVKQASLVKVGTGLRLAAVTGNPLRSTLKWIATDTGAVKREQTFEGSAWIADVYEDRLIFGQTSLSDPFSEVELRTAGDEIVRTPRVAYPEALLKKVIQCDVEKVTFPTFDGLSTPGETTGLHGYLLKPKHPLPAGEERALVLSFYGGSNSYSPEFELLCAAGYDVLTPAPRGTGDFTSTYYNLGNGDLGGAETLDGLAAGRFLQQHLHLPAAHIGIFGGSRGGYDTLRAMTFPGVVNGVKDDFRFGFGISNYGIGDIARAMSGGNISQWYAMLIGGDPAKAPDKWKDRSPETHADLLSGPLLLTHGTNDHRVPITESRSFFTKAKGLGKDVTLVEMEGQGHGYKGVDAQARYYRAVFDFLAHLH